MAPTGDKEVCYLKLKVQVSVRTSTSIESGTESYLVITNVEELEAIATADNYLDLALVYDEEVLDHDCMLDHAVTKAVDDLSQEMNAR